jgi:hypothetical protein
MSRHRQTLEHAQTRLKLVLYDRFGVTGRVKVYNLAG